MLLVCATLLGQAAWQTLQVALAKCHPRLQQVWLSGDEVVTSVGTAIASCGKPVFHARLHAPRQTPLSLTLQPNNSLLDEGFGLL